MPVFQRLEQLPSRGHAGLADHLTADYAELRVLASLGGEYSASDLVEDWKRFRDLTVAGVPTSTPDREPEEEPNDPEYDDDESQNGEEANSEVPDADDELVNSGLIVWENLAWRAEEFGEWYPYEVLDDDASRTLTLRELTPERRLYIFLLLASSLNHIANADRDELTRPFELMSAAVLSAHLPPHADVHIFGTSSRDGDRYRGNLSTKYQLLAEDLNCKLLVADDDRDPHNTGDGGLDIVAWVRLGDQMPEMPLWFVQCGCGKDWHDKQAAVSETYWSKRLKRGRTAGECDDDSVLLPAHRWSRDQRQ